MENRNVRNDNDNNDNQIVVTGRIQENRGGGECIKFHVSLCLFRLTCIVNVPEEGRNEAPVYIRFSLNKNNRNLQVPQDPEVQNRFPRSA